MASVALRSEERVGLVVALAAHAALVALLVLRPPSPQPFPLPERVSVTLSDEAALTSTSPESAAEARPDTAPIVAPITDTMRPPVMQPAPAPRPVAQLVPRTPSLRPAPVRPVQAKPVVKATPQPSAGATRTPPRRQPGATRFGDAFNKGVPGGRTAGAATNPPAAAISSATRSSLVGAISRQLKPKWTAPQGVDVDRLVTVLAWSLNPDGSLAGTPRVIRQDGITDANRAQAHRHAEQAVRAVQLAAPFELPAEYYDAWKRVSDFRFDRRLSQ